MLSSSSSSETSRLLNLQQQQQPSPIDQDDCVDPEDKDDRRGPPPTSTSAAAIEVTNRTVLALAVTVFVQSYLLEGVFPYAGFLTLHLFQNSSGSSSGIESSSPSSSSSSTTTTTTAAATAATTTTTLIINEETVGSYAGYIAASFMIGRTITAVFWGRMADVYGRVVVLEWSLMLSGIASIGFGFASTYRQALLWRFAMGLGNGITGTVKCLLSEIHSMDTSTSTSTSAIDSTTTATTAISTTATHSEKRRQKDQKETKTMAIVYGMRGYGVLLCPVITGYLSDPISQYPDTMARLRLRFLFPSFQLQSFLRAYPFVLPNLVAGLLCWIARSLVAKHVPETLPKDENEHERAKEHGNDHGKGTEPVTLRDLLCGHHQDSSHHHPGDRRQRQQEQHQHQLRNRKIWDRWHHLYVYWAFSFLNLAVDELFPLFCLSKLSGLGILEHQISIIMGGTTVLFIGLQYFLLTALVDKFGLYHTLRIGIFGSIPFSVLIPIGSLWLLADSGGSDGDDGGGVLTLQMVLYLSTVIALTKAFSSVVFSTVTMATNRTVDTVRERATLNGIVSLGGSLAKACGPVVAGNTFSVLVGNVSSSNNSNGLVPDPPYGSIVAYGILSMLGVLLGFQTLGLRRSNE